MILSRSHAARLIAAFALAGAAFAAAAGPVITPAPSVTLTGWAYSGAAYVTTTTPVGNWTGPAGAFRGSLTGAGSMDSASFVTYCIEIEERFYFGATPMTGYALVEGDDYFQQRRGDAGIAEDIGRLMTYAIDHPVTGAGSSTALQLALWNIIYDGDATVRQGSFRVNGSHATTADAWLAGAAATTSRYDVWALTRVGSQDFLALSERRPEQNLSLDVPEPGTLGLTALALASVVLLGRRHSAG